MPNGLRFLQQNIKRASPRSFSITNVISVVFSRPTEVEYARLSPFGEVVDAMKYAGNTFMDRKRANECRSLKYDVAN